MNANTRRSDRPATFGERLARAPRHDELGGTIRRLALSITRDEHLRRDLEQEMACHLLTLGGGRTRSWYLSRLASRARDYRDRRAIDAPLGDNGRAMLDRQTVAIGGLAELDRMQRRPAA